MESKFRISATAPTGYQLNSLAAFGMPYKKHGNGSFTASQDFNSEDEAKAYLIHRAEMYHEDEAELQKAIQQIENYGSLQLDAVSASIDEIPETFE